GTKYEGDVMRWITRWIWQEPLAQQGETIIATDADRNGVLVGYGTWKHVDAFGSTAQQRHIEIAWFGVHSDYQGVSDASGHSVAGVLYATVENAARSHVESTDNMPFTLVCHVDN